MLDLWTQFRRWLAETAEAFARRVRPDYALPVLTTGRAQRFFDLLCDVGLDDAYADAQHGEAVHDGPVSAVEQALGTASNGSAPDDETLHTLRMQFLRAGRLEELNMIILDIPKHHAADVPTDVVEAALGNFTIAWARHISVLVGTRGSVGST